MAAAGTPISDHEPYPNSDETTPSRVWCNGVRLPVADVDIHVRKEGSLDVTRYAEVEFVSPHDGVEWTNAFDTLRPNDQSTPDTVRIDVRDRMTEEFTVAFHGVVTGVGNNASAGESWWGARAEGLGHRLTDIPASKPFSGDNASVEHVYQYVVDRLDDKAPFDVTLGRTANVTTDDTDDDTEDGDDGSSPAAGLPGHYEGSDEPSERDFPSAINTEKTFQYGSDTLSDVIEWVNRKANLYSWLVPTETGAVLVARRNPPVTNHTAHYLDGGDTKVVNNNALSELLPVNTLVVKAPARKSVSKTDTYNLNERGERIVAVKARHRGLYRRAGGTELYADTDTLSDAMTKTDVVSEARKRLKDAIDETTAGDMTTLLRSPITPYDTIEALPTCREQPNEDFSPLTYEVSRVHHEITGSGIPETNLNVGLHTDSVDDIEIIDSWQPEGAS